MGLRINAQKGSGAVRVGCRPPPAASVKTAGHPRPSKRGRYGLAPGPVADVTGAGCEGGGFLRTFCAGVYVPPALQPPLIALFALFARHH
jgi:hypothetical protein